MECLIDHAFTLNDCKNMVELDTRTNNILNFRFLDELIYWNIEEDMVDLGGHKKWQNKLLIKVNPSLTSQESSQSIDRTNFSP
jgi:hypothetical protein